MGISYFVSEFIPRLGGMHMLMSFVGSLGMLMANSGLEDIMKEVFAGVPHMLTGKTLFTKHKNGCRRIAQRCDRNCR